MPPAAPIESVVQVRWADPRHVAVDALGESKLLRPTPGEQNSRRVAGGSSAAGRALLHDLLRELVGAEADAYADALGLVLGPVAWVSEPGMRSTGGPLPAEPAARLAAPAAPDTPAEPPDMGGNLTPSEMIVEVSIEVGFGIA